MNKQVASVTVFVLCPLICYAQTDSSLSSALKPSEIREAYGQGSDQPLPDGVAFFLIADMTHALKEHRYDIARLTVANQMKTDVNETTYILDQLSKVALAINDFIPLELRSRLCELPVETQEQRDLFYKAMEDFDDWKEVYYETAYQDFLSILNADQLKNFASWMRERSRTAVYEKTNHKVGWEGRMGNNAIIRWKEDLCKESL